MAIKGFELHQAECGPKR